MNKPRGLACSQVHSAERVRWAVSSTSSCGCWGASGSGKSSLVFAGLIPRLRQDSQWQIAPFRPKGDPFGELATALTPLLYPELDKLERRKKRNRLVEDLTAGELSLADGVAIVAEQQPEWKLLLIADQFEELYTQNLPEDRQRRFLQSLLSIVQDGLLGSLLIALRADFLSQALACRPLAETIAQYPKQIVPQSLRQVCGRRSKARPDSWGCS